MRTENRRKRSIQLNTATAFDYAPEKEQKVLLENAQALAKYWEA